MTKTGTIVKVMQAVLLVTVLTPATVYADPLSTRQMLAQAETQSQDQTVKGEVKRLNRGLIFGTAEAATNPSAQHSVEIPAISALAATAPTPQILVAAVEAPKMDNLAPSTTKDEKSVTPTTSGTFETAAAPAASTSGTETSSIVTLPAPPPATDTISAPIIPVNSSADVATTPAPAPSVTPVTATQNPAAVITPAATTTTAKVDAIKADAATKTAATKTATARTSHQRRIPNQNDGSFNVAGVNIGSGNIGGQLTKIMNRPEVRSMLTQYGLN